MRRSSYQNSIAAFIATNESEILSELVKNSSFDVTKEQRDAWIEQIDILKKSIFNINGTIFFEFEIPRMGERADVVLLIDAVIFILEFKIGEKEYSAHARNQVLDYALDLHNFHEKSHDKYIAPILVATNAKSMNISINAEAQDDQLIKPVYCNAQTLRLAIETTIQFFHGDPIDPTEWINGRYSPTPTIIEAAKALYKNHAVENITRNDAGATNLTITSLEIGRIIEHSKKANRKSICLVTGVPGAGKTLIGLNVAIQNIDKETSLRAVFLSGNGPLVKILREAIVRDQLQLHKRSNKKTRKGELYTSVKAFIQNVHHFRDECLKNTTEPPIEHVAIFDEAQRAWNLEQTAKFMQQKKKRNDFAWSEPEFLISCLDRHKDWAVIVCLVGGGQEINTGEAGISEWLLALKKTFNHWDIYCAKELFDSEYKAISILQDMSVHQNISYKNNLHLSTSLRSFRAENLSSFVKHILDFNVKEAKESYHLLDNKYPLVITRDIKSAKQWLKQKARGSERFGIIASSHAERLKPYAIDIRSPLDPVHWFLNGFDDVRSSYYLEDAATEFDVQGLELDWVCVTWDADFRYTKSGWDSWSFKGSKWQKIRKPERQIYHKNAYRVLLTRARQGMVIVVPYGDSDDHTRLPQFYDSTYNYLHSIGIKVLE